MGSGELIAFYTPLNSPTLVGLLVACYRPDMDLCAVGVRILTFCYVSMKIQ